jgi:hypothetical protein
VVLDVTKEVTEVAALTLFAVVLLVKDVADVAALTL